MLFFNCQVLLDFLVHRAKQVLLASLDHLEGKEPLDQPARQDQPSVAPQVLQAYPVLLVPLGELQAVSVMGIYWPWATDGLQVTSIVPQ